MSNTNHNKFTINMVSGGIAGLSVDAVLFPLDTLKTRLQSSNGFISSGGFKNIYSGIGSVAIASAPTAALFFVTYEYSKDKLYYHLGNDNNSNINKHKMLLNSIVSSISSGIGESIACIIRVPVENIKQNLQAGLFKNNTLAIKTIYNRNGITGFYTGYSTTLAREIPFAFIQFPLYELLKLKLLSIKQKQDNSIKVSGLECAIIGSICGSIAAALTTPLDVCKTRLMLQQTNKADSTSIIQLMKSIYRRDGMKGLFSGVIPRVMWIGLGGFIFFGAYESTKNFFQKHSTFRCY